MAAENPDAVFASVNLTFWSITLKSVANPVKSSDAKKKSKNQHSSLDSANKVCYSTNRTNGER